MPDEKNKEYCCIECGKKWISWKARKRLFCSSKCQHDFQYKEYIQKWKKGKNSGGRANGWGQISNHVRRYLLEKYDNKCSNCGWHEINQFTNRVHLEVEHLDGNPENHKEENLTVLCPNCHSLSKNNTSSKNNGRRYYRELYKKTEGLRRITA